MGVQRLWDILSEVAQTDVPMSELAGKTIAVDLSSWIVELTSSPAKSQVANILIRNLFFRVSDMLKTGLNLVFVLDGVAPELKSRALAQRQQAMHTGSASCVDLSRAALNSSAAKCVELLRCMGIPCVSSLGEAEATCAYLNKEKMVDGCMTGDGDFFCYGGLTCYRRLRKEGKNYIVDVYESCAIEDKLGLAQSQLISLALMLGSDYDTQGIKQIGKSKALALLQSFRARNIDVLERLSSWRTNTELDEIEEAVNNPCPRANHCKKCEHLGRVSVHQASGCTVCVTAIGCLQSCDIVCSCDWHKWKEHEEVNKLEVSMRRKAIDSCDTFPDPKIIDEYQKGGERNSQGIKAEDLRQTRIEHKNLCARIRSQFHWNKEKTMAKVVPLLINIQLRGDDIGLGGSSCDIQFSPIRILKDCRDNHVECYEVSWRETSEDGNSPKKESLTLKTEKGLFRRNYPYVVEAFEKLKTAKKANKAAKKPRRKRVAESECLANQPKISSLIRVRKRLFDTGTDNSGAFSNKTNSQTVPKSKTCDIMNCLPDNDLLVSSDLQDVDTSPSGQGDSSLSRSPPSDVKPGCSGIGRESKSDYKSGTGRRSKRKPDMDPNQSKIKKFFSAGKL